MPITEMVFSLHAERPGVFGERPRHEVSYPKYKRQVAAKLPDGRWVLEGARKRDLRMAAPYEAHGKVGVLFPECGDGPGCVVRFCVVGAADDDEVLIVVNIDAPIHVERGVAPVVFLDSLAYLADNVAALRRIQLSGVSVEDREALRAIRTTVADAVGHPSRDAALRAIDRLTRG